jgi:hypothetical protein
MSGMDFSHSTSLLILHRVRSRRNEKNLFYRICEAIVDTRFCQWILCTCQIVTLEAQLPDEDPQIHALAHPYRYPRAVRSSCHGNCSSLVVKKYILLRGQVERTSFLLHKVPRSIEYDSAIIFPEMRRDSSSRTLFAMLTSMCVA